MSIKILEQHIADKIAAGEVIERPLSVVKELLENSLDAGASLIEITIKDGGSTLIRVKDNGCGMNADDLAIAFERHATSKIGEFNDLFRLHTFGFRGEALPSIGAVAQVEMISAQKGSTLGHKITVASGVYGPLEAVGAASGTIVEVKNLFYNIPARRKFLKSNSYEAGLIGELVSKYALIHCDVRFKLTIGKQTTIDTENFSTTEERIAYLWGDSLQKHIVTIEQNEFMVNHFVRAWLIKEDVTRNNRSQEVFFINGRLIKSAELSRILEESYYTLLSKGRFPLAVVSLQLPGEELDINIHPAKLEVKINNLERIHQQLVEIFKDALWEASISKNAFLLEDSRILANASLTQKKQSDNVPADTILPNKIQASLPIQETKTTEKPLPTQQSLNFDLPNPLTGPLHLKEPTVVFAADKHLPTKQEASFSKKTDMTAKSSTDLTAAMQREENSPAKKTAKIKDIDALSLLGQLNQSFIIAQNSEGLFIIDQHTCHERILYEKFMQQENDKNIMVENLLIPVNVTVTPEQEGILIEHIVTLRDLGFVLENFGERSYLIRGLPLGLTQEDDPAGLLMDLVNDLSQAKQITPAVIKEKIVTTAACKSAVKARWPLSEVEMMTLLHDLSQVENAHTCPHGRPIIYKLSMRDLYAIFKRGAYPYD